MTNKIHENGASDDLAGAACDRVWGCVVWSTTVDHEENPLAGNDPAGDGELSGQLAVESGKPGEDAEGFLSDERLAAYGCYTRPPTVDELDRFFVLDDEDRNLIADKRGDANRLGFMLQLATLRLSGRVPGRPSRCARDGAGRPPGSVSPTRRA